MRPRSSLASLALLLTLLAGCGCGGPPGPGPVPPPVTSEDEKLLADLDAQIAAKEKELAELRAKADPVRARVAAGKAKGGAASGLAELQKLIAKIPPDHQPTADVIQITKANHWLTENVNGKKSVGITCKVQSVTLTPDTNQDGRYVCTFEVGEPTKIDFDGYQLSKNVAGKVYSGDYYWTTFVRIAPGGEGGPVVSAAEADAKMLRGLQGETVRVSGTINRARFEMGLGVKHLPRFDFDLDNVRINEFDTQRK